jgi:GTP pyrophosphokinase
MDALRVSARDDASPGDLTSRERQGESLRRMLVAMIDDPRVALVKLAERVQALRALSQAPPGVASAVVAREAMDVYVPLAHLLGVGQLKWELEDLAFRYLHPEEYRRIAALLDERRADRERSIAEASRRLGAALAAAGIEAGISGRAKHLYSIWRKMQRKGIEISAVYDVRALRVMVTDTAACYSALGVVHGLWRNLPGEFDDYIANPKRNGYRSLHTAVIGDGGRVLEVQIRTAEMHREAEFGICAHWHYKGVEARGQPGSGYEEKIGWLRQVLGWGEELDAGELLSEQLRRELVEERVYVLTPDGHVVDLPRGATPVDFAYHVHTGLGHRCRGAKVDGRIVSLDHVLATGERVEILRGSAEAPNRAWLLAGNPFVQTARARSKVRHWFREQDRGQQVAAGRAMVERELKRLALGSPALAPLARTLGFAGADELFAALGRGDLGTGALVAVLAPPAPPSLPAALPRAQRGSAPQGAVAVAGIDNLLTQFAGCCSPLPGDPIAGYVTAGRGVSVHRGDCRKLLALAARAPSRLVEVSWQGVQPRLHAVGVKVVASDRPALLQDLVTLLGNERINVLDLRTTVDRHHRVATVWLSLEVVSLQALGRVLERISAISGVLTAQRHLE